MRKSVLYFLCACAMLVSASQLAAHEEHHHHEHDSLGAHVHGEGQLEIAVEGKNVELYLSIPGVDVVGFEHQPKDDKQRQAVDEAIGFLRGNALIRAEGAQCQLINSDVDSQLKTDTREHHHHDHDHDHSETSHAEFRVTQVLECEPGLSGQRIEAHLLEKYDSLERLQVTWITDGGQGSVRLRPQERFFELP